VSSDKNPPLAALRTRRGHIKSSKGVKDTLWSVNPRSRYRGRLEQFSEAACSWSANTYYESSLKNNSRTLFSSKYLRCFTTEVKLGRESESLNKLHNVFIDNAFVSHKCY
jgi:hypothetical protein